MKKLLPNIQLLLIFLLILYIGSAIKGELSFLSEMPAIVAALPVIIIDGIYMILELLKREDWHFASKNRLKVKSWKNFANE